MLRDFRSYEAVELDLEPGVTTFVGRNGNGKTNLVEAIGYLGTLGSHRVATDAPLVRNGCTQAAVGATVQRAGRNVSVQVQIVPGRSNRAWMNRAPLPRPREILGTLRVVVFAPEDIALVKGDPSNRRRFLDDLLALRTPRLGGVRTDYERILRQRTALLRSFRAAGRPGGGALSTLEVWDEQLLAAGAQISAARMQLLHDLDELVSQCYQNLAPGGGPVSLAYQSAARGQADVAGTDDVPSTVPEWHEVLAAALAQRRGEELERGVCLVGPHRDDMILSLRGMPARGYASQGESWSYALSLRLASFALLDGLDDAGPPVLILDDVLAELDASRRERLAAAVLAADQVLVTAAVLEDVPDTLQGVRIRVPEEVTGTDD